MSIEALLQETNTNVLKLIALIQSGAPAANSDTSELSHAAAGNPNAVTATTPALSAEVKAQAAGPAKRGRGRPVKGEETPATSTAQTQPNPVATPAQTAAEPDPFSLEEPAAKEAAPTVTLQDVKAALAVVMAEKDQATALNILKTAAGVETMTKLTPDKFDAVFNAAIPGGKITQANVRAVLVKAQGRIAGAGQKALFEKGGTKELVALTEDKFVAVIIAAHDAK